MYNDANYLIEKSQIIPIFYPIEESTCQNLLRLLGFNDFKFKAPEEVLNEMNVGRVDVEFVRRISKSFMKGGDVKEVNYVYPVYWINPKSDTQKGIINIKAER